MECIFCKLEKSKTGIIPHLKKCKFGPMGMEAISIFFGLDKEKLYNEYIVLERGLKSIATEYKTSLKVIKELLIYHTIKMRTPKEAIQLSNKKMKQVFLEKYGVENPFQIPDVIEKIQYKNSLNKDKIYTKVKQTNIEKYGVENVFQSEDIKEIIKQTNIEKYGSEHIMQVKEFQDKSKKTKLERYGDENYNNREQYKETCLEKYGVENSFQSPDIIEKINCKEKEIKRKETNIKNGL